VTPRRPVLAALTVTCLLITVGCGSQPGSAPAPTPNATTSATTTAPASSSSPSASPSSGTGSTSASPGASTATASTRPTPSPTPSATDSAGATPRPRAAPRFDTDAALLDVRRLARDIGPREATSRGFRRAADLVANRFTQLGYRVRRTTVRVPAGNSWGTPVRRGTSQNVIAEPPGFDPRRPHRVVGAHLDTIPVAPGGEDNASGIAVILELARMATAQRPALPTQFIAFGAEEPRGPGDALHHFGSQQHVADLSAAERDAVAGMVSLDRVGIGVAAGYVPVCRSPLGGRALQRELRSAGRRVAVTTRACENTTSDHWSYAKEGVPAVRFGRLDYPEYHTRRDTYRVVDRPQLDRVGRLTWSWLTSPA
jgi:hypothetical protein